MHAKYNPGVVKHNQDIASVCNSNTIKNDNSKSIYGKIGTQGSRGTTSNQSNARYQAKMNFNLKEDAKFQQAQKEGRYADIDISKYSSSHSRIDESNRDPSSPQIEQNRLSLHPPNIFVEKKKSSVITNTKDDITDNETQTQGEQTSFHLKSGAFHQTLNKKGFVSPNYMRTDTVNNVLLIGKDGTFTPKSSKVVSVQSQAQSFNLKRKETKQMTNMQVKEAQIEQKALQQTVLSQHFSSSQKEGTKLQVVNRTRNKAYMIPGKDMSNNDRVTTLPDPENLPSSPTNGDKSNQQSACYSSSNVAWTPNGTLKHPQSPDVARMTSSIANYLQEHLKPEEGLGKNMEKKKQEQSSALIDNTQMRAHLTTARQQQLQDPAPINPWELFSKKQLKVAKPSGLSQGRVLFSKASARRKGYQTIDDKARKSNKFANFKPQNQRNRANMMSITGGDYGPFNNSALSQTLANGDATLNTRRTQTTSMMNRTSNLLRAQKVGSSRVTQRGMVCSQLTDIIRDSPMLISPFAPKQLRKSNCPEVQFLEGKIPNNNGFFNRRNNGFSIQNQKRPSTQAQFVTNNQTSKQISTIENDASKMLSHGASSSNNTNAGRTRQINQSPSFVKQRDSDQFVQDFMIEQNMIEQAMQSKLSNGSQQIDKAELPSVSIDLTKKGQQSPMSQANAARQRVQAVQNLLPMETFKLQKVNEDRNSQTAPSGMLRTKKQSFKNGKQDNEQVNKMLQDEISPIMNLLENEKMLQGSQDLGQHQGTLQIRTHENSNESGPVENPFGKTTVFNNDYITHNDQLVRAQENGPTKNRYGSIKQSGRNSVTGEDNQDESHGDHDIERGSNFNTPLRMILKSTLNANQRPDPKILAEKARLDQIRKQKELARKKVELRKQFTKEDEQLIIGYIHRQYYKFCKRKEDFLNSNSIVGLSNPTSPYSYNNDLANLQQLTNAAKYKSLYTFSFFKKYVIDKFQEENSGFAVQVAKKALSALEALRTLKRQRSAHFTNIDHGTKTETLGSQDGLDPKVFEHYDIPLSELQSKYQKINAVSEACNRSQLASGGPSRNTEFLPFVRSVRSRDESAITNGDIPENADITMDELQEIARLNQGTGPAPSPKIKILHRPAALFDQSIDMLNSDRGSRQSSKNPELGFIEAQIRSPVGAVEQSIRIPESLSSSFGEYETYIAFIQLQESQIHTQQTKVKKTGVSMSRQKRGGDPSIDLTSLADRKLYTSMKPQIRIQTLDFNKQMAKKGQAARAETLLQKCQKHEKKKIKTLYNKIKSIDPNSKMLKGISSPVKAVRSRNPRINMTANTSINQEGQRTSRGNTQTQPSQREYQDELRDTSTDLGVQATSMNLASKNHAELQRLMEQAFIDKDGRNHVITLVTPGSVPNQYGDTSYRVQRLQNPPMVEEYNYDNNKLPSFGVSIGNTAQISPRHPENLQPKKLSSIHINDMKQAINKGKIGSKQVPSTVRLRLGTYQNTQHGSISSQRSNVLQQQLREDTKTTDSQVMLRTGEQTGKVSYNNDEYNLQDSQYNNNQAYETLNEQNYTPINNQGPILEQHEKLERDNNSNSVLTNKSGNRIQTKRSVLMKQSVDSKVDISNNVTNNAAQSYRHSDIPEKVQDDFLSKENQITGLGSGVAQYDPLYQYALFDQINNKGISSVSSIRDIVPITSVMSNPEHQGNTKINLIQKNLIGGNTEPDQSNQASSDKQLLSEGAKTLLKDGKIPQIMIMTGNNTVKQQERRKQITQPGSQESQEENVLDALGSCYGVMSPEIRRKSTQQRQNDKALKNIRMKNKGNEDLNTIMPASKVKITRTGKPPTLTGSPQVSPGRYRQQKYDSFQKQTMDRDKNSSLNESGNSQLESDPSVHQMRLSSQHHNSQIENNEFQINASDGVKVANLRITDERSKEEYMNEVNNSIVQLQKMMLQQEDFSMQDQLDISPSKIQQEQTSRFQTHRQSERTHSPKQFEINGMIVSFDDQREHLNEFQKMNQGFGDNAQAQSNLKDCIQISKFTGAQSPQKSKRNSKLNSSRYGMNRTCPPVMKKEKQQETQLKIQALQKMQRILIEHSEIENIMLKNQNNLAMQKKLS